MPERHLTAKRRLAAQRVRRVVQPAPGGGGPLPTFGTSLPARIPLSTGTNFYVSTTGSDAASGAIGTPWRTIQHAIDTVPANGSIINVRQGTYSEGEIGVNRTGNASNPITIQSFPGETATVSGGRFLTYTDAGNASYVRIQNLNITGGSDGWKIEYGHHMEINNCVISGQANMGVLLGGGATQTTDVQVWNCRISGIGDFNPTANQDHGIYTTNVDRVVVANCLIYDIVSGFGIQIYPETHNSFFVNCTIDDIGTSDGCPIIIGSDLGAAFVNNNRIHGCVLTNSTTGHGAISPFIALQSNQASDCIAFNTSSGFPAMSGITYTNCSAATNPQYLDAGSRDYRIGPSSPAINKAVARPQFTPALDINGTPRVTADAGCFAA